MVKGSQPRVFKARVFYVLFLCAAFLAACQSAAEKDSAALKQDAQALSQLAQIDKSVNQTTSITAETFAALKTIREKYPNAPEVRRTYKTALIIRKDWTSLEDFLLQTADQLSAEDRQDLGKVYFKNGKYEKAIETLKPLAEADPNDVEARSLLGHSYFYLNKHAEAGAELDSVWDKIVAGKRVADITARGIIYSQQNNFPKATEILKLAFEIDPTNPASSIALSQAYARQGNLEEAEFYRQKGVEMYDKNTAATFEMSRRVQKIYEIEAAWNSKNYAQVIDLVTKTLAMGVDKNQKSILYRYLFESHKALGNQAEANSILAEAQKLQQ